MLHGPLEGRLSLSSDEPSFNLLSIGDLSVGAQSDHTSAARARTEAQ